MMDVTVDGLTRKKKKDRRDQEQKRIRRLPPPQFNNDADGIRWFREQVETAARTKKRHTVYDVVLTRDLAAYLLSRNTGNRDVSDEFVKRYAEDARLDNWRPNGESIKIATEGEMNDGQHRCWAVVAYDVEIVVDFTFGLERESRQTLDQGKKRTASDITTLGELGVQSVNTVTAALRYLLAWDDVTDRASATTVVNAIKDYPKLTAVVPYARRVNSVLKTPKPGLAAALAERFERCNPLENACFWAQLADGANLAPDSPIYQLRRRLQNIVVKRERVHDSVIIAIFVKTWNAYRIGVTMKTVPRYDPERESWPELLREDVVSEIVRKYG